MPSALPTDSRPARSVARHAVRDHIARKISNGAYKPGTKLVQQRLAEELGISRAVVREALFELHGMGVVKATDQRGATIDGFDRNRLLESFELREILEGLAARRCCRRITVQQLRDLRAMAEEIYRLRTSGEFEESSRLDRQFHLRLTEIADSELLQRLSSTCVVLSKCVMIRIADAEQTRADHLRILDEIEAGRPEAAEDAARAAVRTATLLIEQYSLDQLQLKWIV